MAALDEGQGPAKLGYLSRGRALGKKEHTLPSSTFARRGKRLAIHCEPDSLKAYKNHCRHVP